MGVGPLNPTVLTFLAGLLVTAILVTQNVKGAIFWVLYSPLWQFILLDAGGAVQQRVL
jgi:xanthine/uracil/vitamin C permease (AzgA family)